VKRAVLALALGLAITTVFARELPPQRSVTPVQAATLPTGYVFDNPQLLAQQLLWGIVHGVRLLGITCQARGYSGAAEAYADWMDRQKNRLQAAERDLARHYFGRDTAAPEDISAALLLKPALDISPELLAAACNSLPEALQKERYDLEKFYADRRAAIEHGDPEFPGAVWLEPENNESKPPADVPVEAEKENE